MTRTLLSCILLAGALPLRAWGTPPDLEAEVERLLRGAELPSGEASITVLDDAGRPRVAIHSRLPMKPASNMKVLTTLAALDLLGPDYEYRTVLWAETPPAGGVIRGDVVLFGTGDPNISGRFYEGDSLRLFRRWARGLRRRGVESIQGDLVVDDRFFDRERYLESWKRSAIGRPYAAEVSPLNLNDNCVEVKISPSLPGRSAEVEIAPASAFITVEGAPVTRAGGDAEVLIHRSLDRNRLKISGRMPRHRAEWLDQVAVHDPALFFAHTFARVLAEEKVALRGDVRRLDERGEERRKRRGSVPSSPPADVGAESARGEGDLPAAERGLLLIDHRSPLAVDLPVINKESENLHAEVLLKTLGARVEGEGSVSGGARAVRRFLENKGIPVADLVIADGSGLSHENRVSTAVLAAVLHTARGETYFDVFRDSLAVAGVDGTLEKRFVRERRLRGRVFAKTGYISGVSALSGYLESEKGLWTFSMLFGRLPGGNSSIKRLQERILALIDRQ